MPRILVKAAPGLAGKTLTFGAAGGSVTVSRLFDSIGARPALGATADDVWYVLTPPPATAEENPWDVCHTLLQQGFGVAGASPKFAEPDIEQKWITGSPSESGQSLTQSCDV